MQILKTTSLSILVLLIGVFAKAQDLKFNTLFLVVGEIAATNVYESTATVGFAGAPSKQLERFKQLIALANEQQLLDLAANHKHGVVRLYALKALVHKKVVLPVALLSQFKNDAEKVIQLNGCIGTETTVRALALLYTTRALVVPAEVEQ